MNCSWYPPTPTPQSRGWLPSLSLSEQLSKSSHFSHVTKGLPHPSIYRRNRILLHIRVGVRVCEGVQLVRVRVRFRVGVIF